MAGGQVRLDPVVMAELQQRAAASGRSVSAEANAWLRLALRLEPGAQTAAAERHQLRPASISVASLPGAQQRHPHPIPQR